MDKASGLASSSILSSTHHQPIYKFMCMGFTNRHGHTKDIDKGRCRYRHIKRAHYDDSIREHIYARSVRRAERPLYSKHTTTASLLISLQGGDRTPLLY